MATPVAEDTNPDNEVDERFRALMEGLRTSLPGVQVLFAFLLVAPFQSDFADVGTTTLTTYTVAFFSAGVASVLLIAPSVHQRLRAPASGMARKSERHLSIAIWLTIAGTAAMAVAIVSTVFLVCTLVFDLWVSIAATGALGAVLGWAWVYVPLVTFGK